MRAVKWIRAVLLWVLVLWSILYLPVYMAKGAIPAPLSACQIPLLPVFYGVNFWYVLYAAFFLAALVCTLFSAAARFARRISVVLVPSLMLALDLVGQYFCYQAAGFEDLTTGGMQAYYYFNGITPTPAWHYLVAMALDVLWLLLLLLPPLVPRLKRRKGPELPARDTGIVLDNWSEIFSGSSPTDVGEEYNTSGEKKEKFDDSSVYKRQKSLYNSMNPTERERNHGKEDSD